MSRVYGRLLQVHGEEPLISTFMHCHYIFDNCKFYYNTLCWCQLVSADTGVVIRVKESIRMVMTERDQGDDQRELVTSSEQDIGLIRDLEHFLHEQAHRSAKLVAADGEEIDIPASVYAALRRIVPLMAEGAAIGLVPLHQELTTQQAADLLNISRPSLIKHLDAGDIPYRKTEGEHRRIRFVDVMEYKRRRSELRHDAFVTMAAIGQKYGAYNADSDDSLFGVDVDVDEANDEQARE